MHGNSSVKFFWLIIYPDTSDYFPLLPYHFSMFLSFFFIFYMILFLFKNTIQIGYIHKVDPSY